VSFRSLLVAVALLSLLFLGAACGSRDPAPGAKEPPAPAGSESELKPPLDWPEPGQPAPAFRLPALAGGEVTVPGDFEGRAVLMLFFSMG